uniref:Uncharacterized protein n=1 Tax=Ditylenchus dipsaci TaxID=166011 RepID=A0A915EMB6_9BILA
MDLLKRCSGSTFCHYAKICQKGIYSVFRLYYPGVSSSSVGNLAFVRRLNSNLVGNHSQPYLLVKRSHATFSAQKHGSDLSSFTPLPEEIAEGLRKLQIEVIKSLLDEASLLGAVSMTEKPSSFTDNLQEMAKYYFDQGGKLLRPTVSLLMGSACNQSVDTLDLSAQKLSEIQLNQYRIAMVSEMIHTASLPTANARWGNRQAVLVGDFILARATKVLCTIGQPKVISTMAEIVEDLVKGELMQLTCPTNLDAMKRFQHYMQRTSYKTASLFANSCKSVAMLAGSFQLIDDVLDYVASSNELGKPTTSDLKQVLLRLLFSSLPKNSLSYFFSTKKLPNGRMVRDCLIEIVMSQLDRNR